jgi:vancomycin resistance protein YoaR
VVASALAAVDNISAADTEVTIEGTTVEPAVSTEAAQAAADQAERVTSTPLTVSGQELTATIDPQMLRGWARLDPVGVGQWKVSIDEGPIAQYVASYALETDVPATNATFSLVNGKIQVVASAEGRATDVQATADNMFAALQARADGQPTDNASLALVPTEPTLTTDQARAIAPRVKKLGEWTTHYNPDPALNGNGVNLQIPTNILDGQVVEPGGQFDFLTAIGPIKSPPYVLGGALVHGQIVEDSIIGGGMCSVSTTLFNAALRYGLPIWARDNHSLYISRYPVGLDATVWSTGPRNRQTMGFVNDTGYPLVIRGINGPATVTFQIWGVDDGRTVELSEARVENKVKPNYMLVEYTNDLPPGRRSVYNDAYVAFDSWVTRTVRSRTGEVMIEETYRSHYKQLPRIVRVGRQEGDPRAGRVVRVRLDVTQPDPDPAPEE